MYENDSYHIVDRGLLEVTVSKEFFAAEPSARQQALVNLWHLSRPKDQCAYRRRMLLCIVKLPLALLFYPIRALLQFLLAFAAFMSGMRGVTFRPILHPFGNEFMDVTPDEEKCSCVFLSDADGNRRNRILLAFMPSLWLCVFLAGRIITHSLHKWSYISWRSLLLWSPIVVFAVVTLIILFDRLGEFVVGLSGYDAVEKAAKHEKVKLMRKKAKEDAERRKFEQKFDEYDQYLSCSADTDFVPSVSALPLAKQTLHLRFHDLKARVCKPFAR